jgi:hypothetical protein
MSSVGRCLATTAVSMFVLLSLPSNGLYDNFYATCRYTSVSPQSKIFWMIGSRVLTLQNSSTAMFQFWDYKIHAHSCTICTLMKTCIRLRVCMAEADLPGTTTRKKHWWRLRSQKHDKLMNYRINADANEWHLRIQLKLMIYGTVTHF